MSHDGTLFLVRCRGCLSAGFEIRPPEFGSLPFVEISNTLLDTELVPERIPKLLDPGLTISLSPRSVHRAKFIIVKPCFPGRNNLPVLTARLLLSKKPLSYLRLLPLLGG